MIPADRPRLWHMLAMTASQFWKQPTLEVAFVLLFIARECRLRLLVSKNLQDLLVRDIAVLEVLLHHKTVLVANCHLFTRNQSAASIVCLTHIAVDASPPISTVALCSLPRRPVPAIGQRAAKWFRTVFSTPSLGTRTSSGCSGTVSELVALESF